MDFSLSPRATDLRDRVRVFLDTEIEPVEAALNAEVLSRRESGGDPWTPSPVIKELQAKARAQGLWNLFLPAEHAGRYAAEFGTDGGEGLSNVDYAPVAEVMGRSALAPLVFNSNAPDTGNMEVLLKYGTPEQQREWLEPMLDARIRSAFCMTEPRWPPPTRPTWRRRRSSRATRWSSTAASGSPPGSATPSARSSSSWGCPTPTPTVTRGTPWCSCRGTPPA